tara:strand:- start:473 stop:625 length:153 start_codon:yes stop_codon:yes gene_type:complete
MGSEGFTLDQRFIKIRLDLVSLLLEVEDKQKRNTYILQLETLIKAIKHQN